MKKSYFNSQAARTLINTYKFSLFPIHGVDENNLCTCGNAACTNPGKHPATPNGFKDATNNIEELLTLWQGRKHLNVGIATGAPSGVFVIDIDSAEGKAALEALGTIPETLKVTTGKGAHLYFKYPGEPVITKRGILEGVDVRGDGGYVAGPGSNHASGRVYEFANPLEEIAEAPGFILDLVVKSRITQTPLPLAANTGLFLRTLDGWSVDDVRQHLSYINPDCGYDDWIKIGMALHQEGMPLAIWDEWSRGGTKYDNSTAMHWKSFKKGGGVSYGTVVAMAKAGGWRKTYEASQSFAVSPTAISHNMEQINPETGEIIILPEAAKRSLYYTPARAITFNMQDTSLIKDVLGQEELSVIYGESNCGKTFFMTDLAFHVARGIEWNNHRTAQGGVMYAALEGAKGLSSRFEAYCKHHDIERDFPFALMPCALDFYSENANIGEFIDLIKSAQDDIGDPKLVVVDTLARALAGGDENSGQDMGRLVYYADMIRRETKAHLSFVHHSGKNKALGARGHSSLRAAVDTEIEISRDDGAEISTIRFVKQREMEMIDDIAFALKRVVIGINNFTEEVTSCVVVPAEKLESTHRKSLTPKQEFVYEAIIAAIDRYGKERTPISGMQPVLSITYDNFAEVLEEMGFGKMFTEDGEQNALKATKETRIQLKGRGCIGFTNNLVWILSKQLSH